MPRACQLLFHCIYFLLADIAQANHLCSLNMTESVNVRRATHAQADKTDADVFNFWRAIAAHIKAGSSGITAIIKTGIVVKTCCLPYQAGT